MKQCHVQDKVNGMPCKWSSPVELKQTQASNFAQAADFHCEGWSMTSAHPDC